jgi:hypothetical protein
MYLSYTYYLKNSVTGQFYYGSRCQNVKRNKHPHEDFWITYFTSSKEVQTLRKIYGDQSFEWSIIHTSAIYEECYSYEQSMIKPNILNPLCINKYYIDINSKRKKFSTNGFATAKNSNTGEIIYILSSAVQP